MTPRAPQSAPASDLAALEDLLPSLEWLDAVLLAAENSLGHDSARASAAALPGGTRMPVPGTSMLARLSAVYGLDDFDVKVMVLALAAELDRRYSRLYALLVQEPGTRLATVTLALQLFAEDGVDRLRLRRRFRHDAPLLAGRIISLVGSADGSNGTAAPLLTAAQLRLDEQVTHALLGHEGPDRRLVHLVRPLATGDHPLDDHVWRSLVADVEAERRTHGFARLLVTGAPGSGRRGVARGLADALGLTAIELPLARLAKAAEPERLTEIVLREAWLSNVALCVSLPDDQEADADALAAYVDVRGAKPPLIVVTASGERLPEGVHIPRVRLGRPSQSARKRLWASALGAVSPDEPWLDSLSRRFALTPQQVHTAMAEARSGARASDGAGSIPARVVAAARRAAGADVARLTTRIEPARSWDDLVVPADVKDHLREMCCRVEGQATVLDTWGFGASLSRGKGINALFSGPPGTGKTMAAEVVAHTLGVDVFRVELAGVVSKYIGETERNLDRIFDASTYAGGVLLFDEADALFGKRSEVHDAHDRYANIEISYLLQRMEEYEGVAILSTNLRGNLDAAFMRRLAFTIHFPLPDIASRLAIWESVWPAATPRDANLPLQQLARQFPISGGHIRNIALAAAFLAAANGGHVTTAHVLAATAREYQKLGKQLSEQDLAPFRRSPVTS